MPYIIRKVRNQNLYSVKNIETGEVHSKGTSKENALKQVRLLQAIDHGFKPTIRGGSLNSLKNNTIYKFLKQFYNDNQIYNISKEIIKIGNTNYKMKGGFLSKTKTMDLTKYAFYLISTFGLALCLAFANQYVNELTHNNNYDKQYEPVYLDEDTVRL
jgi:hypothetical protein